MPKITIQDSIFDGFMHRPYTPTTDGWVNEMPDPSEYPAVQLAEHILSMFDEIRVLRKRNWELKQQLASEQKISKAYGMPNSVVEVVWCSTCYNLHRLDYNGDCRNNAESFSSVDDAERRLGKHVIEVEK